MLEKYKIINKNQFGFLKRKSSNDTVIPLTESVNSLLEEYEPVVSIFLHLAKAFNSISHKIFLEKIAKYGFSTESIAMLESFLSNRKQCVTSGIEYSNWVTINHGVPQGIVLGPLIFIMYINNFPEKMKNNRTFYSLQMTHALFVIANPMKIFYAKLTMCLKILTVIWGKICYL